jgi:Family of unknown function (DUF5678)
VTAAGCIAIRDALGDDGGTPRKEEAIVVMATTPPNLDNAREAWERAEAQETFWRDHYREFLEEYPNEFVAVIDGAVVATDSDLQHLLWILEKKGVSRQGAWVRFIATDPSPVIV